MRPDYKKKIAICKDCQSKKSLNDYLKLNSDVNEIWGDHAIFWDFELETNTLTMPLFFLDKLFYFGKKDLLDPIFAETFTIFNFMINKKMDHRYLTLRLVEYFDLGNFDYTYSGSAKNITDDRIFQDLKDCDPDRKKFPPERLMQILGDVTIEPKFFGIDNFLSGALETDRISEHGKPLFFSWKSGLDQIFGNSFISLITESDNGDYDKVTVITEKTLYAILGLTIPVWPGGYRHAEGMQEMGFDVFTDLIDHSYQHESTMFMRCFRAFEDNIDILKDLQRAKWLRKEIMPRLVRNRDHLFSSQLIDWYMNRFKTWKNCDESMCNLLTWYPNAQRHLHLPIKT